MHTRASSAFDDRMILTFDLLALEVMYAQRLPCITCLPDFVVLIAKAVFLLVCGHTYSHSHHWSAYLHIRFCKKYTLASIVTVGPFLVAYQNLTGRCLVCKHGSHVINILKADWSSVKNKQLTATPCSVLVGDKKRALCIFDMWCCMFVCVI